MQWWDQRMKAAIDPTGSNQSFGHRYCIRGSLPPPYPLITSPTICKSSRALLHPPNPLPHNQPLHGSHKNRELLSPVLHSRSPDVPLKPCHLGTSSRLLPGPQLVLVSKFRSLRSLGLGICVPSGVRLGDERVCVCAFDPWV